MTERTSWTNVPEDTVLAQAESKARRELSPTDGSIATSGEHASIYCATCERWIDAYDEIPPEIVIQRHRLLVH